MKAIHFKIIEELYASYIILIEKNIRRMYVIKAETDVIRAWQGHKIESKWFFVLSCAFQVQTINMLDLNNRQNIFLKSSENLVLNIEPVNYDGLWHWKIQANY